MSLTTVSNTLNRPAMVSPMTRGRVQQALADLGFARNGVARSVSVGVNPSVGLILRDLSSFCVEFARGAQDELHDRGLVTLIANSTGDADRERHHLQVFAELRAAGVLIVTVQPPDGANRRIGHTPTVVISDAGVAATGAEIFADAGQAGGIAAHHLLASGCTRLAFVAGPMTDAVVRRRFEEASRTTVANPTARVEYVPVDSMGFEDGRRAADGIRARGVGFYDGIIAGSDQLAMGILQTLHGMVGFHVPSDLSLIGIGGDALAAATAPALTTVAYPAEDMGRAAARLLVSGFNGEAAGGGLVEFEPQLVARDTSRALPLSRE